MKRTKRWFAAGLTALALAGMVGCKAKEQAEEGDAITVYLNQANYLSEYAPYIQEQFPDMDIRFIVGRDTVEFYEFMQEHGKLPDILMVGSLSLRDSLDFNEHLLDLSLTETAASYHTSYLEQYRCEDGSIRWLPSGGVIHGILANQDLFDQYGIALPTDYASFVSACDAFAEHGIRGFNSDYKYDYTCLYTMEGTSIPKLMGLDGIAWRYDYVNGLTDELDEKLWTQVFENVGTFVGDVGCVPEDVTRGYTMTREELAAGKLAMLRGTTADIEDYGNYGNMVMLPCFGETEEDSWLLTEPAFHVSLGGQLTEDEERQEQVLKVLDVMLSKEALEALNQYYLYIHPYSQGGNFRLPEKLENLAPLIQRNHLYIAQTSADFYAVAKAAVHGLITGEYDAREAYQAASEVLRGNRTAPKEDTVVTLDTAYPYEFLPDEGNPAASAVVNTLRSAAGTDLFLAPACISTGSLYACDYTELQLDSAFQSSGNRLYTCERTGAEIRELVRLSVEGCGLDTDPFSDETLPVAGGMTMIVSKEGDSYRLKDILVDGASLDDEDIYSIGIADHPDRVFLLIQAALGEGAFETFTSSGDVYARMIWLNHLKAGNVMEKATPYIVLK